MAALTTTLLLPLIGWHPAMAGPQAVTVVWVSTPRDTWGDRTEARAAILAGLRWWEARTDVRFTATESDLVTDVDILDRNVCRDDHAWLPAQITGPTLYLVAVEPTERALVCDGVAVGDYTIDKQAIVWGGLVGDAPTDQATIAHTVAHLYGARDTHAGMPDGPSGDIMDRAVYVQAYRDGTVADSTWRAIGGW